MSNETELAFEKIRETPEYKEALQQMGYEWSDSYARFATMDDYTLTYRTGVAFGLFLEEVRIPANHVHRGTDARHLVFLEKRAMRIIVVMLTWALRPHAFKCGDIVRNKDYPSGRGTVVGFDGSLVLVRWNGYASKRVEKCEPDMIEAADPLCAVGYIVRFVHVAWEWRVTSVYVDDSGTERVKASRSGRGCYGPGDEIDAKVEEVCEVHRPIA